MVVGLVLILLFLVAAPLTALVWSSFQNVSSPLETGPVTLSNYVSAFSSQATYSLLINSLVFSVGTLFVALPLGVCLAWLVERSDIPGRNFIYATMPIANATPGMLYAIAWVLLLSPQIGLFNELPKMVFGAPLFTPYSLYSMCLVEGFRLTPTVFLIMAGLFRGMDPRLEEASIASGAGTIVTMRRVTLPMMLPGILSAGVYIFMSTLSAFEIPAVMGMSAGIYVFSTKIYEATHEYPRAYGMASTLSMILLFFSILLIFLYGYLTKRAERYITITGKDYRPKIFSLGKTRYVALCFYIIYFLLVIAAPNMIIVWASLLPYYQVPSIKAVNSISLNAYINVVQLPHWGEAVRNTITLVIGVSTLSVVIASCVSWSIVRSKIAVIVKLVLDSLSFAPHAVPGVVLGLALVWFYVSTPLHVLYGTIWLIMIGQITNYLPFSVRALNAALCQVSNELEEAAVVSGAGPVKTFTSITARLVMPVLVNGWLWVAYHSVRELSIAVMLYGPGSFILSVLIWSLWANGDVAEAAAAAVLLILAVTLLMYIGVRRLVGERKE